MPSTASTLTRRVLAAAVCLTLAGAAALASPRPATAEELTALLARPVSPGSIGLLVEHAGQPAAQKRLAEAIKDERPEVRAVAARVAFITMSKGLAPALITTLAKEAHPYTAGEQVRALTLLLGAPGDDIVLRAVKRLGGPTATAMAEVLARMRGADIVKHLSTFLEVGDQRELAAALALACAQHPAAADAVTQAALDSNSWLWEGLLGFMREAARPVPSGALLRALQSGNESQRTAAVWHLFYSLTSGDDIPEEILAAAAPKAIAPDAKAGDLTWEAFGREMLARVRGSRATAADWAGMMKGEANSARAQSLPLEGYAYLTSQETAALGAVRGDRHAGTLKRVARSARRNDKEFDTRAQVMRTIPGFARGMFADLMAVTGCRRPGADQFAAGQMTYRPDGSAKSISFIQTSISKECEAFVRAMMMLTIASADHPVAPDLADHILLLFEPRYLACADDPFPPTRPAGRGESYEFAKERRGPSFMYPDAARRFDVEGVVRLRARVSHTGCISSAETIRSVHPILDLTAIQAMVDASYHPARMDGQPVESFVYRSFQFYRP